ncbi:gamma-glutamyltransferase [Methylocella sp.]|uniref:gamma-glutamyltransferase n=1 Tax=Methylocella sp. TaxID=1978226 RepID=UPI00378361CC
MTFDLLRAFSRPRHRARGFIRVALFCALAAAVPARAEAPAPNPPIISQGRRFLPVLAEHGMVVAQEAQAARVGRDVLRRGGNAVDAAVATALALAVTLPRAGNLGGGGFMLIHSPKSGETVAVDYRETAPAAATRDMFLDAAGEADPAKSRFSGLAVGVPGTVAGLTRALRRYGSGRLTLAELAAPAVRLAREGFTVGDDLADSLAQAARLGGFPSSARIFMRAPGEPLRRGDLLRQTDLADVIEAVGRDGERAFYEGPVAEKIVAAVRGAGGVMTLDDLKSYRALERAPVRGHYRGHEIVSMPPPSSGGTHVIELLNILEGLPLADLGAGSAASIHLFAEATKLVYADRARYLGDPDFVEVPLAALTSKAYAARLRGEIDPARARPAAEIMPVDPTPYESAETTHFSIVDAEGGAVANTYTLNFSYGLGLVADGAGVLLNNELDDFAAKPGAPNAFGLMGGAANAPASGKRPLSSMAPTMVFRGGELELVTGSPGGSRIITTVAGLIVGMIDHGLNPAEATAAPRAHHQGFPDALYVERGVSPDTLALLRGLGHTVVEGGAWGSAQSVLRRPDGLLEGAADSRQRGTLAAGY